MSESYGDPSVPRGGAEPPGNGCRPPGARPTSSLRRVDGDGGAGQRPGRLLWPKAVFPLPVAAVFPLPIANGSGNGAASNGAASNARRSNGSSASAAHAVAPLPVPVADRPAAPGQLPIPASPAPGPASAAAHAVAPLPVPVVDRPAAPDDWSASPAPGPGMERRQRSLSQRLAGIGVPLVVFVASRAVLAVVLFLAERLPGSGKAGRFLAAGTAGRYLAVAERGYPRTLVHTPGGSRLAYSPLYPMMIRLLHRLAGMSIERSAIVISLACSAVAMVVIWLVIDRLTGSPSTATRSVILVSFFPWSFVLSMANPDGLLLLLAAVCLLALLDDQWLTAGLAALLAGVTSPYGLLLVVPCLWAAVASIRSQRQWDALLAPVLAPLGVFGFFGYLKARTGKFFAAILAQVRGVTYSGIGTQPKAARQLLSAFSRHPTANLNLLASLATLLVIVAGVGALVYLRPKGLVWAFVVPFIAAGLWLNTFASLPVVVLLAFPLLAGFAWSVRRSGFAIVVAISASLMAMLFVLIGLTSLVVP
ncbi:MAG TPA: glycosyltransferase family 39 protein [Actinomycetota bacterium]|nr:glycosyltransferase family 39 protein [Actinomycetota bacterium]